MQEVPKRLQTTASQLDDLYQHLDSFIDELKSEPSPLEPKVRWDKLVFRVGGVISVQLTVAQNVCSNSIIFLFLESD